MARGRKPKPTALKKLAGNPGKRPLNAAEPKPPPEAPDPPRHLNDEARAEWQWLCATLHQLKLLAKSDKAIMTLYCETWAEYVRVRKDVEEYGFVMISPKTGSPFVNPLANVEASLKKQLLQYLSELGLSPTSRTRLHVAPDDPADPLSQLIASINERRSRPQPN